MNSRFCSYCCLEYARINCSCRVDVYCSLKCKEKADETHKVQCKMYRNDPCVFFEHRHKLEIAKLSKVFNTPITQPPKYLLFREIMVEGKLQTFITHYYNLEFLVLLPESLIDQEQLTKALKIHEECKGNAMTFIVHSDKHPKYRIWLKTVSRESETVVKIIQTIDIGKRKTIITTTTKEEERKGKEKEKEAIINKQI